MVSHGGAWDLQHPYDSFGAFQQAAALGTDAVKGDFRVTGDGVGVVTHSSPVEWYESPGCAGLVVENSTAAKVTSCKMALTNYTFMEAKDLLAWAEGRVIVMFCVKRPQDIAAAVQTIIAGNAQGRAFLEVRVPDLVAASHTVPDFDKVYFLAEGGSAADIDTLLNATAVVPRAFTFEFDPSYAKWGINVTDAILHRLLPAGIRSLAATSTFFPSIQSHVDLWQSFDVVYSYDTQNGVVARTQVDTARGISPP